MRKTDFSEEVRKWRKSEIEPFPKALFVLQFSSWRLIQVPAFAAVSSFARAEVRKGLFQNRFGRVLPG